MSWKSVCKLDDLPLGGLTVVTIDGVEVLLARSDKCVTAMPPLCPHMKEPLVNGVFDGENLTCLKHLWQWDVKTGESLGEAEKPLCQYQLRVTDGHVDINMAEELKYEYEA